jgi:phage tail-like protein
MKHRHPSHALSFILLLAIFPLIAAPSVNNRPYQTMRYTLELDGVISGDIMSVDGGYPVGEVANEPLGSDNIQRKHISNVKYEDLVITVGTDMSSDLYNWINDTMTGKNPRKNGAVIYSDFNGQVTNRLVFFNAMIKEISFPAFDASTKDAGKITLRLGCGYTQKSPSGGSVPKSFGSKNKRWMLNSFKLQIDGLDDAVSRAYRIESIVISQKTSKNNTGSGKNAFYTETAGIEVSNIVVSFPEDYAGSFLQWQEDFLIKGGRNLEKTGSIEALGTNLRDTFFTLKLTNLGLVKITPDGDDKTKTTLRRLKAEIYCEQVEFNYNDKSEESNDGDGSRVSG